MGDIGLAKSSDSMAGALHATPIPATKQHDMRILLADDQELVRETLAAFLGTESDTEVVTCRDLPAAMAALEDQGPFDIILLDYMMPGMNGLAGLKAVRSIAKTTPIAILSGVASRSIVEQALAEGASGYLSKSMTTRSLIAAVRFMAAGEVYAPIGLMSEPDKVRTMQGEVHLTQRELEVLKGLCRGQSNKEIAIDLNVQEVTVKLHIKSLYRKVGAKNRTHAVIIARNSGLG